MEKLNRASSASFPVNPELPIFQALRVGFEPFALHRPMKLFGGALGLPVGSEGAPDSDFLVHLVEGAGHQQLLRVATDRHYKNFENFVRRRNGTTQTTKRILLASLGMDEATLDLLAHGMPDGPLLPAYAEIFEALEGLFLRLYGSVTIGRVPCSCCGRDLLDDADDWWGAQPLQLEAGAYRFIDRLLKVMVVAIAMVFLLDSDSSIDMDCVRRLSAADCHPIGQWINMVRSARGLASDWQLTVGTDRAGKPVGPVSDGRMRKWRSGQDLLPQPKALMMLNGTAEAKKLKQALLAARTIALAIDIVQATAVQPNGPPRRLAQEVVDARLARIVRHISLSLAALAANGNAKAFTRPVPTGL